MSLSNLDAPHVAENFLAHRFYAPVPILTQEEATEVVNAFQQFELDSLAHLGKVHRFKAHLLSPDLARIATHPRVLAVATAILGPDVLLWSSDFFVKPGGSTGYVSWHQDSTHAGLDPTDDIVNLWLALTPSKSASGCLRVIAGTHDAGQLTHTNKEDADNMLFFGQTVDVESDSVALPLEAGEASLHSMRIVHGSEPNRSDGPRIGMVLRFIHPSVRQTKARDSATLVAGVDAFNHFDHEPIPTSHFASDAIAAFKDAIRRPSGLG
ncbi:putative phytanoyl-CoA dioxygenase family protein [Octadecabacter antarcticus 307]|uniref:Putative phytanoyl-CoA dioxygenase family protein n=1 Tax=Octadecabacter antarcticus 307 TaxID=391626 RepID=M9R5M7_9RHOB|nr:phytanoyl-CoA dioxygenase family protein [Octadecabacter antarcticus]AGI67507.1 putative phytanoyl-CoA dioxygenase family protein [Octadecabacter antarcticus 307]